ncbi:hypothetical protein K1719_022972 [Acacia pycnantha]|nr:hypothetical protein K1719_022972 [Acacia pycnantha]
MCYHDILNHQGLAGFLTDDGCSFMALCIDLEAQAGRRCALYLLDFGTKDAYSKEEIDLVRNLLARHLLQHIDDSREAILVYISGIHIQTGVKLDGEGEDVEKRGELGQTWSYGERRKIEMLQTWIIAF